MDAVVIFAAVLAALVVHDLVKVIRPTWRRYQGIHVSGGAPWHYKLRRAIEWTWGS